MFSIDALKRLLIYIMFLSCFSCQHSTIAPNQPAVIKDTLTLLDTLLKLPKMPSLWEYVSTDTSFGTSSYVCTTDSFVLMGGPAQPVTSFGGYYWAAKYTSTGNLLWINKYSLQYPNINMDAATTIVILADGTYLLMGCNNQASFMFNIGASGNLISSHIIDKAQIAYGYQLTFKNTPTKFILFGIYCPGYGISNQLSAWVTDSAFNIQDTIKLPIINPIAWVNCSVTNTHNGNMVFDEYRVLLCGNVVDEYGESDGYLMAALFSFGIGDTPDKNSLMVTWAKTYGGKGNQAINDFCVINNIFWATGKNDSSTSLLDIDMANGTLQNEYDFNIGANSSGLALFPYKNNVGICGQFYDKPTRSLQGYVIAVNNKGLPQSFQVLENIFPYSASHSPINNQIILAGSKNNLMWLGSF